MLTPKEALAAKVKAHASKGPAPKAPAKSEAGSSSFAAPLVSVGAAEAVEALQKAGDAAAALVDAWAQASNAAAVVEAAENDAAPPSARKAAKRALNVLRARGVAIPARERAEKKEEVAAAAVEAVFTSPDSQGTFVVSLTKREPSGRLHLAELMIREPFGVLQAWSGWISSSQLKDARARQAENYGVAPVPVPAAWAQHRVSTARKQNASSGQVVPLGFDACASLLESGADASQAPPHPLAALEAEITVEQASAAAAASGLLHAEPEFRGWVADRAAVNDLLLKLGQRIGPTGQDLGREAFDAVLAEEVAAATDRFFTPEARALLASRMRDAAISIRARRGDRAASEVLAVARAVVDAGLITSPPREIPFLRQFFEIGLRALASQTGGELRVPVAAPPG